MTTADKTVIVTGGNSGLGFETARAILKKGDGWHVVIAGRSPQRCEEAASRLSPATGTPVEAITLDLASLAAIRQFALVYSAGHRPPLRALVCNAGVQHVGTTQRTADGFESTFGVNHLGHFLLANLLLRHLEAPGRIIFVSSGTHDPNQRSGMPAPRLKDARSLAAPDEDEEEAGRRPGFVGRRRYTTSKLCNVLCTYEMDRRLREGGASTPELPISVNAFDPGAMPGTGLARSYGLVARFAWNSVGSVLRWALQPFHVNIHRPEDSGRALARLVLDPALESVSGRYFEGLREIRSSAESYDAAKAAALWEQSAELVGLSSDGVTRPLSTPVPT